MTDDNGQTTDTGNGADAAGTNGAATGTATAVDFEQFNVGKLKEFARDAGITPGTKTKPELIQALIDAGYEPKDTGTSDDSTREPTDEENELADAKLRIAELEAEKAEAEAAARKLNAKPGTREAAAVANDIAKPHRLWASRDCPQNAPTVCGVDFPKWTDPPALDEEGEILRDGDDVRRHYQKGHIVMLSQAKVNAIKAKLDEPIRVDDDGRLVSGKVAMVDTENGLHTPLGPLGKWLHLELVSGSEGGTNPNIDELRSLDHQLNSLYRRSREEERAENPDKRKLRDLDGKIDELEAGRKALSGV